MSSSPAALAQLRVDQVGSLLRPPLLKTAFTQFHQGQIADQELRKAQDEAVREVIATQEAHGLPVLTDGEFRRLNFMESFGEVAGMEAWQAQWRHVVDELNATRDRASGQIQRGTNPVLHVRQPVSGKLRLGRSRTLDEFQSAQSTASRPVKITLINPDRILGFE